MGVMIHASLRKLTSLVALAALAASAGAATPVEARPASHTATAVLAGGCFWGMEDVFESLKGVTNVVAGFAGGSAATAQYETVSTGTTGHAESVQITYDPSQISYDQLLAVYFTVAHDPTELNRQGPDEGTQYRSAIFYANAAQQRAALSYIRKLTAAKTFSAPIVTQVVALHGFYAAEAYHQHYARLHPDDPYIVYNDAPKVVQLKKLFPNLIAKPVG